MSSAQKAAWFNLIVIVATALLVAALYPTLGARAAGGFGLLGLCGLAVLFYRSKRGQVMFDERDTMIQRRALAWAYAVLWLVFVAAVMAAPAVYGDSVPVFAVQSALWAAFLVLIGVQSIATLILYGRGTGDGR